MILPTTLTNRYEVLTMPIFSVKTLRKRHARMMQDAIEEAQDRARTRLLPSHTGEDMLEAAREALRERNRYSDVVAMHGRNGSSETDTGVLVKADAEGVPNSYKYGAEATNAQLVLKVDPDTGEERWEFYTKRGWARQVPHGAAARCVAIVDIPVGASEDEDAAREARSRLQDREWHVWGNELRKEYF